MRGILVELAAAGIIALYVSAILLIAAWFTVLPSIGLLWSVGWLK
jgi:hypothetical protein